MLELMTPRGVMHIMGITYVDHQADSGVNDIRDAGVHRTQRGDNRAFARPGTVTSARGIAPVPEFIPAKTTALRQRWAVVIVAGVESDRGDSDW